MNIKGYVHTSPDEAFFANVHIVKDIRFYAGEEVGYMELTNGDEWIFNDNEENIKAFLKTAEIEEV